MPRTNEQAVQLHQSPTQVGLGSLSKDCLHRQDGRSQPVPRRACVYTWLRRYAGTPSADAAQRIAAGPGCMHATDTDNPRYPRYPPAAAHPSRVSGFSPPVTPRNSTANPGLALCVLCMYHTPRSFRQSMMGGCGRLVLLRTWHVDLPTTRSLACRPRQHANVFEPGSCFRSACTKKQSRQQSVSVRNMRP